MPLFSRRSRSVSVSRPTTPATNSPAMLAASQAFTSNQGPQSKLATGAAAAALRSMSPANTPVGQVQTRRMVERQGSNGSSAARGRSRGNNMVRRSSSGSMTGRTFREPSPGRPASAQAVAAPSRQPEPPVPKVPDNYTNYNNIPPVPKKTTRRSASIDELGMRKDASARNAAKRISVPNPPAVKPVTNPGLTAARRVTSGPDPPQLARTDSNNGHNFSYPNRARPTSPPPQSPQLPVQTPRQKQPKAAMSPTTTSPVAATPKGITQTEAQQIKNSVVQAAQQPVKKKKSKSGPLNEGSHLQTGTMGQKATVTPLAPGPPPQEAATTIDTDSDPNAAKLAGQGSHFPTSPTSPTDSQASASDSEKTQARRKQRASGNLQKQPSIVREDWEGEQEDGISSAEPSPAANRLSSIKSQSTEANVSRKIESGAAKPDQKSPAALPAAVANLKTPEPRKSSLSPSRSTRFSSRLSADMTEGQKHEPPPRSVSPRKSVLKHSPSLKAQTTDAYRQRESSLSPSEATDISFEGTQKPRKSAHVKFDTQPSVVGVAAEPQTPVSDTAFSPQYRNEKSWFKKAPNRVWLSEDSDEEDAMKPRPMLPTFGSVRGGRRNEVEQSSGQKATSSPSSSSASSFSGTAVRTMDTSISSDHAVGGLLSREAQENQKQHIHGSPLPPQVTSVEGSGLHSDTDSVYSQGEEHTAARAATAVPAQEISAQPMNEHRAPIHDADEVPAIAVQPATPGDDELRSKDSWIVEVPGGFPSSAQELDSTEVQPPSVRSTEPQKTKTSYTSIYDAVTAAELPSERYSEVHDQQPNQDRMPAIEEESDRDSVYSDAAEEMNGDGFGSIAAIVHSPVPPSPVTQTQLADSPTSSPPHRDIQQEVESPSEWESAGARWKDHLENVKRASLQPAAPIVESQPSSGTKPAQRQPTAKAAARASPMTATPAPQPVRIQQQSQQPGFKKSMRGQAQGTGSTLRNSGQSSRDAPQPMRSSMRNSAPPTSAAMNSQGLSQTVGTLQKKSLRAPAAAPQQRLPPVNDDSDSESSFKRRRRAKAAGGDKYTMRRSMRSGSDSGPSAPSIQPGRATSPVERRPFSPVGGATSMRTTMRGSMDNTPTLRGTAARGSVDNTPTLRGNSGKEKRSSSLFGRKKANDPPPRPMSSAGFSRSRMNADSDDEDDKRKVPFKSRFGDSSDEEEGDLRPVRGIPRNNRDDDSTDLEDSSDEEKKKRTSRPAMPSSPQQSDRPMSPTSPEGKKKRGFFGRLKKGKDEPGSPKPEPVSVSAQSEKKVKPPKQGAETAALGFRSDAEKEALIEQTRQRLEAAHQQSSPARATSPRPSTPGKLQRRHTPQRIMSDSWPLPPKIPDDVESPNTNRPMTSDGTATPKRPDLERNPSSATTPASPGGSSNDAYGKTGKKKRFPMLRKAFGLKD